MTRVLLVEDNEINRDMLSRRLARRGYQVMLAADGIEALSCAAAKTPDIVLMDLQLPRLDGWEAIRRLRAGTHGQSLAIIALSADTLVEDVERALDAGADAFHSKPVDFARLLERMTSLLDGGGRA